MRIDSSPTTNGRSISTGSDFPRGMSMWRFVMVVGTHVRAIGVGATASGTGAAIATSETCGAHAMQTINAKAERTTP